MRELLPLTMLERQSRGVGVRGVRGEVHDELLKRHSIVTWEKLQSLTLTLLLHRKTENKLCSCRTR